MKKTLAERFWEKVDRKQDNDCWLWTSGKYANGYGRFRGYIKQGGAHRMSWELTFGTIPSDLFVLHKCDVRDCVNPRHLFLGTKKDNTQDMIIKGRRGYTGKSGHRNSNSKLTQDQIILIGNDNRKLKIIAKDYGISVRQACIVRMSTRKLNHA